MDSGLIQPYLGICYNSLMFRLLPRSFCEIWQIFESEREREKCTKYQCKK